MAHVAVFLERYYAFVDAGARDAFCSSPVKYFGALLALARRSPELIHMLRLQEHFPAASIAEIMRQNTQLGSSPMPSHVKASQDAAVQTPTHFIEKCLDRTYDWNEWGLRKRAMYLANMRRKATTSQQTETSAFRRQAGTQVYLQVHNGTMTGVSTGTQSSLSREYVAGLRGPPDSTMEVINCAVDREDTFGFCR